MSREKPIKKSPVKERILQVVDYKGDNPNKFYLKSGVTRGVLTQDTGITEQNISRFFDVYPDVSPEWLLTGRGPMLREGAPPQAVPAPPKGIPLIPIDAMAGVARGEINVFELDCEHFVVPSFRGADYLITVKGSSMIPKYNSGDIVACKNVALQDVFFQWNKVYVLDTEQGALIKRVHEGEDDDHITLVSDNKEYKPFKLHRSQIYAIAIVVGVIRSE